MGKKEIVDQLKKFKRKLNKEIPIEKLIFFGSRASGKPKKWSDIDLIIVSAAFKHKKTFKRAIGLYDMWTLDYPVDFLCYTPEEFDEFAKHMTIVRAAIKEGVEI